MRLSEYTDYTLRVLMYCAAHPGRQVTIAQLAEHHGVSRNHLMKIVNDLARRGVLATTRGRGGGLRLLGRPEDIRIGDVVRASETDFRLAECFDARTDTCMLTPHCRLRGAFRAALDAYFEALDRVTLADVAAAPPAGGVRSAKRGVRAVVPISVARTRRRAEGGDPRWRAARPRR